MGKKIFKALDIITVVTFVPFVWMLSKNAIEVLKLVQGHSSSWVVPFLICNSVIILVTNFLRSYKRLTKKSKA